MRRLAVLLAIAACYEPADPDAPPRAWVIAPAPVAWTLGPRVGAIGRSQAPAPTIREGLSGAVVGPIRLPTVWPVPGDGAARAAVYGTVDGAPAIELVDIDAGTITWRDATACAGPIVGVTSEAIVCADGRGTRAVSLAGKHLWNSDGAMFMAMTEARVAIAGAGEEVIVDANDGGELAHVKLPPAITSDSIIASCGDAGRELFAYGQDGKLVRIAEAPGGPKATWAVPLETVAGIDACEGGSIIVTLSTARGTALVALARETGAQLGRVDDVQGYWPARDGSVRLEVSTSATVSTFERTLAPSAPGASEPIALPPLGELLAKRGDRRLVRATPLTAVLLDGKGVRAYLPLAKMGAALGERSILAGSWLGSPGETLVRLAIPDRYRRQLRLSPPRQGIALPAELRDLPDAIDVGVPSAREGEPWDPHSPVLEVNRAAAVALDPYDPQSLATAAMGPMVGSASEDDASSILARFDLRTHALLWSHPEGCGAGTAVGVAVARDVLLCAVRGKRAAVRATSRDGTPRWQRAVENVDGVAAAGDVVLAFDADRLEVLDGVDGHFLAVQVSDDGAPVRAAAIDLAGMVVLVAAERGRIVARLPRAHMLPTWSLDVAGAVTDVSAAGDGVLVSLEDGDAYRVDARTGAAVAIPGLHLTWRASGELVTGEAPGGPIPPDKPWLPPAPKVPPRPASAADKERDPDVPPELPKPWPPPPPMRASWQYALYELTGAVRARNDYALADPVSPVRARTSGAPLVVQSGPGLRDVLVIDSDNGDPLRRVRLPESAAPGIAFSTVLDGKPLVGALLVSPLRIVMF